MIDLYYYKSPNGRKVLMALEEMGLPYEVHWVDIAAGKQHEDEFLTISPSGKIPAIVDRDAKDGPIKLFESGAILLYLAEKSGLFLPRGASRQRAISWLCWQVSQQGPMLGQAAYFHSHARANGIEIPHAVDRYVGEARKCYQAMETRLEDHEWIAGSFSIADIALFPWTRVCRGHGIDIADYPNVRKWSDAIAARPSAKVKPAVELQLGSKAGHSYTDERARKALFGESLPN